MSNGERVTKFHRTVFIRIIFVRLYRLDGNEYLACLPNGFWNGTVPECKAIGCEHPGSFPNGAVENNGLLLGNTVRFYCHSGHVMVGPTDATCQADGSWTNSLPTCQGTLPTFLLKLN